MRVTRDVIYDLLPMYFAGDASQDTRSLIEEFFAGDPEFGRMAERFRMLMAERRSAGDAVTEADRAKIVFERARARVKLRLVAVAWALGAVFPFGMAILMGLPPFSFRHPGVVIGAVFSIAALVTWLMSFSGHPERWYAAFSGSDDGDSKTATRTGAFNDERNDAL